MILDGRDLVRFGAGWFARVAPPVLRTAARAWDPARAVREQREGHARHLADRRARALGCVRYAETHGLRSSDDAARALARLFQGENVELLAALARTKQGVRLWYSPGVVDQVEFDLTRLQNWCIGAGVVYVGHQHLPLCPEDRFCDDLDRPSVCDVRLARSLKRDLPCRLADCIVIDATTCSASESEVRYFSFSEWTFAAADRDVIDVTDDDDHTPALAARGWRR